MTSDTLARRLVGLIGWPVEHSLSPFMHNAAFAALGLDWNFIPLPLEPGDKRRVKKMVGGLAGRGFAGANVTVPHKRAVLPYIDEISETAAVIGAVNTIVIETTGRIVGENTDAAGFLADLERNDIDPGGTTALLIGAGGSARAVAYALGSKGAARVTVAARKAGDARILAAEMSERYPRIAYTTAPLSEALQGEIDKATLVVNCTPVGMAGHAEESLPLPVERIRFRSGQVVYDLVYNPLRTALVERAAACGANARGGLGMLVHQGATSLEMWTGRKPPLEVMEKAALQRLQEQ